jgi:chromosome segregation ATPase
MYPSIATVHQRSELLSLISRIESLQDQVDHLSRVQGEENNSKVATVTSATSRPLSLIPSVDQSPVRLEPLLIDSLREEIHGLQRDVKALEALCNLSDRTVSTLSTSLSKQASALEKLTEEVHDYSDTIEDLHKKERDLRSLYEKDKERYDKLQKEVEGTQVNLQLIVKESGNIQAAITNIIQR